MQTFDWNICPIFSLSPKYDVARVCQMLSVMYKWNIKFDIFKLWLQIGTFDEVIA